jgi:hypothetical protein
MASTSGYGVNASQDACGGSSTCDTADPMAHPERVKASAATHTDAVRRRLTRRR